MGLFSIIPAPASPFEPPTLLYRLATSPVQLAIFYIHKLLVALRGPPYKLLPDPIRIVCISDTHTHTAVSLPPGDVLIHAGDMTNLGTVSEIQAQLDWLSGQPFEHIIAIAGNHDSFFDPHSRRSSDKGLSLDHKKVHYLQHSGITLKFPAKGNRQLKLYGAPQIPACGGVEHAFQYEREDDAWSGTLPENLDVLITHTPPKWHLDLPAGVGCEYLRREVWRVKPLLHVFGHVHGGSGTETVFWGRAQAAFENVCARQSIWSWLSIRPWLDAFRVILHGLLGIAWSRIWGAEGDATVMINAGLVDWRNKLVNRPKSVNI